ncbi:MAG: hypothetical protein ACK54Z_02970 [Cyanobacteriota bacterium]
MTFTRTVDPRAALMPMLGRENQALAPMLDQRMEVRVSEAFKTRMEEIADSQGLSVADVFRRAMGLYDLAYEGEKKGAYLAFVQLPEDEHGQPKVIKTFSL